MCCIGGGSSQLMLVLPPPPRQDFICEHYGEDSSAYNQEIKELMELRQVR